MTKDRSNSLTKHGDYKNLNERYLSDNEFKAWVDMLAARMLDGKVTSMQMRDICYMACLKAESMRPFPRFHVRKAIEGDL